jgi:hypothetical protein
MMNLEIPSSATVSSYLVEVRPEPAGHFTARLVGSIDLHATAATREEAVEQLRTLLRERLDSGLLEWIDVPRENPLMARFGWARSDPTFGEYLDEIRKFREEVDRRENQASDADECSDTSLTRTGRSEG